MTMGGPQGTDKTLLAASMNLHYFVLTFSNFNFINSS